MMQVQRNTRNVNRWNVVLCSTIMAVAIPLTACAENLALGDPRQMTFKPVEFTPPEPDRVVLENGMVVYLLEDHELPLVSITATMRTGGWLDPADKVGLASLTGSIMRTGGGGGLSAEQVDEELEQFAGDVGISIGRQSGAASWSWDEGGPAPRSPEPRAGRSPSRHRAGRPRSCRSAARSRPPVG